MSRLCRPFKKVLYEWMLLLNTCCLLALTQCDLQPQKDVLDDAENTFKMDLHQVLQKFGSQRRTPTNEERKSLPSISFHQIGADGLVSLTAGCIARIMDSNMVFVADSENNLRLFQNVSYVLVNGSLSKSFVSLQAFGYGRQVWLITHHGSRKNQQSLVRYINLYEFKASSAKLQHDQIVTFKHPSLVAVTKLGFRVFVTTATAKAARPAYTIFLWVGTNFRVVLRRQVKNNCAAVATWHMEGDIYIACSFVRRKESAIHKFNIHSKKMNQIQVLEINMDVIKHFEETGRHFLVCGTINSVAIYWWSGSEFLLHQEISVGERVSDIAVTGFRKKMLLAVVLKHEVKILIQETFQHYVVVSAIPFPSQNNLKSVILWNQGSLLYLQPIFNPARPSAVYEIHLNYVHSDPGKRSLEDCLETVYDRLKERGKKLEELATRAKYIWRPSVKAELSSVEVQGNVISMATVRVHGLSFVTSTSSPDAVWNFHDNLENTAIELRSQVSKSVLKSGDQILKSNLYFKNQTIFQNAKVVNFGKHTILNRVPTHRLQFAMRKKGQQKFLSSVKLGGAQCKSMTIMRLNGKALEDYVFLSGVPNYITGHFTFGNILTSTIRTDNINEIDVGDLILTSGDQTVKDTKVFTSLKSKIIGTESLNKKNTEKIKNVVHLDTKNKISSLNCTSTLVIIGDLNLTSFNGKLFSKLLSSSVRKDLLQSIIGNKRFSAVTIEGDVDVLGHINNIKPSKLMTIQTDQTIKGAVTFFNRIKFDNIETDSVNEHDLSQSAVKKSENTAINGVKTFTQTIDVSNINIGEGVTIDSFDPSVEMKEIILCNQSFESGNSCQFNDNVTMGNVTVLHDAEIYGTLEGFLLSKLIDGVWLRTKQQNISQLMAKHITVNQLEVSRIHGIDVKNLVPTNGNTSIDSLKEFEAAEIENLILKDRVYVNVTQLWDSGIRLKILGNVTFQDLVMKSNLDVTGAINGVESEFLSRRNFQKLDGKFEFEDVQMDGLESKNLSLQFITVNDLNFTDYTERSVLLSKKIDVSNKHFEDLECSAMNINGTLNNMSLDKVMTTDTAQNVSGMLRFNNSLKFEKHVDVKNFNDVQLENIVYKDGVQNISNKFFKRSVRVNGVNVRGYINGVNITQLHLTAFNKTCNNTMKERLTVNSIMKGTNIHVDGGTVDDVSLEHLILLNDTIRLDSLNASSIVVHNVNVTGLINKCNWTSVLQRGLLLKKISQNVTARKNMKSLVIDGNLTMGYANGVWVSDLIPLLNRSFDSETGDFTFESLEVDSVAFKDTVNGADIGFLVNDSVRINGSQIISGSKSFKDINVANVSIQSFNSSRLCGINLVDLFNFSVSRKAAHQEISLTKLPGIFAEHVTVRGNLNNLSLPEDVVLTNTSDKLTHDVTLNGTLKVTSGLYAFGNINGIDFKKFLEDRITLRGSENISSHLTFEEDTTVKGNITINGAVNTIRIKDNVTKVQGMMVSGNLNFTELTILSNLTIKGNVNGMPLEEWKKKLVLSSRNEHLKDTATFSNLTLSSLTCHAINGVNMTDFSNRIHSVVHRTNYKLDNITAVIFKHQDSLRNQSDAAEHPLSLYSYLEINQCLNLGPVQRFLPVYEYGVLGPKHEIHVDQVIIWVKKTNDSCRDTKSLVADVLPNCTLKVTKMMQGKIFPFSLSVERDGVIGFYIQADHAQRCLLGKTKRIIITMLFASGFNTSAKIESPANATLLDVQILEIHDVFLISSYLRQGTCGRIIVHQFNSQNNTWSFHQEFHSLELSSFDIISVEDHSPEAAYLPPNFYIAITGQDTTPGVSVYEWDFDTDEFTFKTNISTSVSSSALWVYHDQMLYLLLAKENTKVLKDNNTWVNVYNEPLEVYALIEDELVLNHTVNVPGVKTLELFTLEGEVFVLGSSNHMETVYLMQLRGYNGFEAVQEISAPGITRAHAFTIGRHLYVALSSNSGHSKVLKAVIRGGRLDFE